MVLLIRVIRRSQQNIMLESPHVSKTGSMRPWQPSCAGLRTQASCPVPCMSELVSSAHDWHRTHLIVTHALEALLGSLLLGSLLVVAMADTPTQTVYHSLCDPKRCSIGALGDGIVKDPLDRLVVLLQALVEQ